VLTEHLQIQKLFNLDVLYVIPNRPERFLPASAIARGALGNFLGIFNTAEINNIHRNMATMSK
jgi:hypothetical protein